MAEPLPQFEAWCARLRDAVRARDWSALTSVDAQIADWLRDHDVALASPGERAACKQLRVAHRQAMHECRQEALRLERTMAQMREHREGWQAYGESQTWFAASRHAKAAP